MRGSYFQASLADHPGDEDDKIDAAAEKSAAAKHLHMAEGEEHLLEGLAADILKKNNKVAIEPEHGDNWVGE